MSPLLASTLLAVLATNPVTQAPVSDKPTVGFYMTAEARPGKATGVMRSFGVIAEFCSEHFAKLYSVALYEEVYGETDEFHWFGSWASYADWEELVDRRRRGEDWVAPEWEESVADSRARTLIPLAGKARPPGNFRWVRTARAAHGQQGRAQLAARKLTDQLNASYSEIRVQCFVEEFGTRARIVFVCDFATLASWGAFQEKLFTDGAYAQALDDFSGTLAPDGLVDKLLRRLF